ncbi:MAG: hypothetical protein IJ948_04530, partial [Clostridia bacterium]|nr:hypothetical protein [Clostridia bacterium]
GKNHTIILSSHILSEIQAVCKRVIIINRGEIIADDTAENLAHRLSDNKTLLARIVCNEEDMLETLKTVKGVKSVTSLGQMESGSYDFVIEPMDGNDIRADIFDRVVSRGKKLLALNDNRLSLEQVFLRLTDMDTKEAKELLGAEEITETETEEEEEA